MEALALRNRRDEGTISSRELRTAKGKIEEKMDRLLDEPDLHDESLRFAIHLLRYGDGMFLFLDRPDVDATNYRAEQAIRPAVINRKTRRPIRAVAGTSSFTSSCFRRAISNYFACWKDSICNWR